MEIFTFLHMGGALNRIDIKLIAAANRSPAMAMAFLTDQFKHFKAAKAQCFMSADRHKLLAVIEAAFGDFKVFDKSVRTTFEMRLEASAEASRLVQVGQDFSNPNSQPRG